MKHKVSITIILLSMFLITQFIGLYVVNYYSHETNDLPYGMNQDVDPVSAFPSIIVSFVIAIVLLFLLIKFKVDIVLRIWFLIVIALALAISLNSFIPKFNYSSLVILLFAIGLALIKVFKKNFIIHNTTELLIYPGIAAIFVPLLSFWTLIAFLVLISFYDMWAVWKSGIMQKMAKYQMNTLKVFGGFFVPYLSKKQRQNMKKAKKLKSNSKKKMKVNVAILGGGDVIFPIISAGVFIYLSAKGNLPSYLSSLGASLFGIPGLRTSLFVILGATLGLGYLLMVSKKKKFYPAMPFITAGIFLGILFSYILGLF